MERGDGGMYEPQEIGVTRDGQAIAGWLVTCNPEMWDVTRWFDDHDRVGSWSVQQNYRSEMMGPGDLCFLWVGGKDSPTHTPGIWAIGLVTSPWLYSDTERSELWMDLEKAESVDTHVGLDLRLIQEPVPRETLQNDPEFADAEVVRVPQTSNPQVLRPKHVAALYRLIPDFNDVLAQVESGEIALRALAEGIVAEQGLGEIGASRWDSHEQVLGFELYQSLDDDVPIGVVLCKSPNTAGYSRVTDSMVRLAGSVLDAGGIVVLLDLEVSDGGEWSYDITNPWTPDFGI